MLSLRRAAPVALAALRRDRAKLEGAGRVEPLPEAGMELYAAKLSLPQRVLRITGQIQRI